MGSPTLQFTRDSSTLRVHSGHCLRTSRVDKRDLDEQKHLISARLSFGAYFHIRERLRLEIEKSFE